MIKRPFTFILLFLFGSFVIFSCSQETETSNTATSGQAEPAEDAMEEESSERLVSLAGNITEALYRFGMGDQLVATDVTSTYPEEANDLPKLGHVSQLSVEGVISTKPTKVLLLEDDLSSTEVEKLEQAQVEVVAFTKPEDWESFQAFYSEIGKRFGQEATAAAIVTRVKEVKDSLPKTGKKVLFIYARSAGNMMVGGGNTAVSEVLAWAGAENAAEELKGYKPFSPEALVDYDPDALLFFESGLKSVGGIDGVLGMPGVAETKAGQNKLIIGMDGAKLAGMGPRTAEALIELNKALN